MREDAASRREPRRGTKMVRRWYEDGTITREETTREVMDDGVIRASIVSAYGTCSLDGTKKRSASSARIFARKEVKAPRSRTQLSGHRNVRHRHAGFSPEMMTRTTPKFHPFCVWEEKPGRVHVGI